MVSRVHPRYEYILEVLAPVSSCWYIDPDWGGVGGIRHHGVRGCVVIRRESPVSAEALCFVRHGCGSICRYLNLSGMGRPLLAFDKGGILSREIR